MTAQHVAIQAVVGQGKMADVLLIRMIRSTMRATVQTTMAVEDFKVTLPELLDTMTPGDEVIVTG